MIACQGSLGCQPTLVAPARAPSTAPALTSSQAEPIAIIVERSPRAATLDPPAAAPNPVTAIFVPALPVSNLLPPPAVEAAQHGASGQQPEADLLEPCRSAAFALDVVMQACGAGGRQAARDLMEQALMRARAGGVALTCSSCHVDQVDFALAPNAVNDLRPWL